MLTPPRLVLCGLGLTFVAWSCSPPCDPIPSNVNNICHVADAGPIAPNASFVLQGSANNFGSTCDVTITDGGIDLQVIGTNGCSIGGAAGVRAAPGPVKCVIPALAAGTYTVNSQPALTITIPGDAGVPPCL